MSKRTCPKVYRHQTDLKRRHASRTNESLPPNAVEDNPELCGKDMAKRVNESDNCPFFAAKEQLGWLISRLKKDEITPQYATVAGDSFFMNLYLPGIPEHPQALSITQRRALRESLNGTIKTLPAQI